MVSLSPPSPSMSAPLGSALTPERIEAALDAAGIGVWELDVTGQHFTCSSRCKQVFGLPAEAAVTLADVVAATHPEDRAVLEQHLDQALDPRGTGRLSVEHRVLLPGSDIRWVRTTGLALFNEARTQPVRFQGITKDITDTQAGVQRQAQQSRELEFLVESIPGILWTALPDGAVTYFNQRWMQYTGQTLEQALSWGWEPVIHPNDLATCLAHWTQALRSGEPYEVEYRFRQHDGTYRWFVGRALPLRDAAGQVAKWFGTCTDIHEQKLTEQALRQREEEIERAYQDLEAKVTFRTLTLEEEIRSLRHRMSELLGNGIDNPSSSSQK